MRLAVIRLVEKNPGEYKQGLDPTTLDSPSLPWLDGLDIKPVDCRRNPFAFGTNLAYVIAVLATGFQEINSFIVDITLKVWYYKTS